MADNALRGFGNPSPTADELRRAGLRPTRQRLDLSRILFARGHRHLSAEDLQADAESAGIHVSFATIYNTLHQFTAAGLLREVAIDGTRAYFDTNVSHHHHFFVEGEERLIDMQGDLKIESLPEPPAGTEVASVEVVVRVRRRES